MKRTRAALTIMVVMMLAVGTASAGSAIIGSVAGSKNAGDAQDSADAATTAAQNASEEAAAAGAAAQAAGDAANAAGCALNTVVPEVDGASPYTPPPGFPACT